VAQTIISVTRVAKALRASSATAPMLSYNDLRVVVTGLARKGQLSLYVGDPSSLKGRWGYTFTYNHISDVVAAQVMRV